LTRHTVPRKARHRAPLDVASLLSRPRDYAALSGRGIGQPAAQARWLTTRTFSGALIEARRLEPGTVLVRTFNGETNGYEP
jgi:hypothetical protein